MPVTLQHAAQEFEQAVSSEHTLPHEFEPQQVSQHSDKDKSHNFQTWSSSCTKTISVCLPAHVDKAVHAYLPDHPTSSSGPRRRAELVSLLAAGQAVVREGRLRWHRGFG